MKLDELKSLVAKAFEQATTKEQIEAAALINNKIDEVATEQAELTKQNKELLDNYKDVVLHTAVKPNPNDAANNPASNELDLDSYIENWASTHDENGNAK